MFDSLSDRLGDVFDRLRRHGALTEDDVGAALRQIRIALLEADVALPVVRDFVAAVREKALGQEVLRSVTPAQMVVKIVHDHLVEVLGGGLDRTRAEGIDLNAPPRQYIGDCVLKNNAQGIAGAFRGVAVDLCEPEDRELHLIAPREDT